MSSPPLLLWHPASWTHRRALPQPAAGAPPPLQLLPSAPHPAHPGWQRAPSFAAAAALLVPPGAPVGWDGKQQSPRAADLAAAAAIASASGIGCRALWALGSRPGFFVCGTRYPHLMGLRHRQRHLLPLTLQLLPLQDGGMQPANSGMSGVGGSSSSSSTDRSSSSSSFETSEASGQQRQQQRQRQRRRAVAIFHEIAADQTLHGLRLLGWLLVHLFR